MYRSLCFSLFLVVISFSSYSAMTSKVLPVSSYIDKSKLYPYSLSAEAHPSSFLLFYKQNEKKFDDATGKITVTSTIPEEESLEFSYALQLIENQSKCERIIGDSSGDIILDIMNVFIDGVEVKEEDITTSKPLNNLNDDGYRFSESSILLRSDTFEEGGWECSGNVTLIAEMAL